MHGHKIYSWNLTSGQNPVHTRVDVHRRKVLSYNFRYGVYRKMLMIQLCYKN